MSRIISEPRDFAEFAILPVYVKYYWLKATLKEIKNLINNNNFVIYFPEKVDIVTPCMDFYKTKIQYNGSIDKLKLIIVVRGDFRNK